MFPHGSSITSNVVSKDVFKHLKMSSSLKKKQTNTNKEKKTLPSKKKKKKSKGVVRAADHRVEVEVGSLLAHSIFGFAS